MTKARRSRALGWTLAVALAVAAPVLLLAGCGGASGSGGTAGATASPITVPVASSPASAAASAGASGSSPAPNVVEQAPVQHVKVGDLDVGYRTIGPFGAAADSTPLLMIMGSSGTMDEWSPQFVEALAQGREVVVIDNRGMGETNDPGGAYQFSQLADDTAALIKALGLDKPDVLGWSMGGDVALDLAVRYPAEVRRLVSYAGDAGGAHAVPMSKKTLAVLTDTSGTAEQRGMRLLTLLFPAAYRTANPAYAESFPIPQEQAAPAQIALQASLTGHLVLSTLHTSNTIETVARLVDLGAESWIVANSLLAVVAQRLVRVLCQECAEPYELANDLSDEDGLILMEAGTPLKMPRGCAKCHDTGYRGRCGIFEVLEIDDEIRELIKQRAAAKDYRAAVHAAGLLPLREAGLNKAKAGVTSLEEVLRVT